MINVVAIITAKPGKRDELLSLFNANVPAVRAEDGCIEYGAAIDTEGMGSFQAKLGEDSFAVLEKWESKEALMAHAVSDHMKDYGKKSKDLVADKAIHILSNV
ncbi:putative quinol monooxygenase [Sneathiella glossodoripedis]|uniref:putative quinol monooxygenase n=1 Tax=Sneathiella glossodoripedis TaxID=418853 RepID=UPI000472E3CE|nr:putative quinol monooxygenase [Sneathiella glossodoripedis]